MPTPAPPQNPAQAPSASGVTGTGIVGLPQNVSRPLTREDVLLLQNRRSELSYQLSSATGRRSDVVREMSRSTNGREGLDARLKVLDERIVQLEKDIASLQGKTDPASVAALALAQKTLADYKEIGKFPKAKRDYNAFELTIAKRFSKTWYLNASYVYARTIGNYSGLYQATTGQSDPNSRRSGPSRSSISRRCAGGWPLTSR